MKFDGQTLTVASFEPDRNPVIQAKAQASWVARILKESTGKKFLVRPVILFPGWFIEPMTAMQGTCGSWNRRLFQLFSRVRCEF